MSKEFKCECGNVCKLSDGEEQTEVYGQGDRENVGRTLKCKCCGKILNTEKNTC